MSEAAVSEQAIEWVIRIAEPDADWERFTEWLAANPAHAAAYEAVLAAGEAADPVLAAAPEVTVERTPTRRRWLIGGSAIAASVAGLIAWVSLPPASDPYVVSTVPGERRVIEMGDVRVALNGDTRLQLDRRNTRVATLEHGEALFDVRHDQAHPFEVRVGSAVLQDVGTRYDVTSAGGQMRLAVAEGAVLFNPGREDVRVDAGRELIVKAGAAQLRQTPPQTVGGWREGRFVYVKAPLDTIAADLARASGMPIEAGGVAAQTFTGVISYTGDRTALAANLGPLLRVDVVSDRGRLLLGRPRANR